jgi:hypothetical protein
MLWLSIGMSMGTMVHVTILGIDMDEGSQPTMATMVLWLYGIPAIGGFVVVGQMLKAFGDCKSVY